MMTVARQDEALWEADPENCCSAVKVGQLDRALAGKQAWMSGLRRSEAANRETTPAIARDIRGLVKINPIVTWSDEDVAGYIADHGVPVNPLTTMGYPSIGCMPCTTPVGDGEDPRAGRWRGTDKSECGLPQPSILGNWCPRPVTQRGLSGLGDGACGRQLMRRRPAGCGRGPRRPPRCLAEQPRISATWASSSAPAPSG